MSKPSQMTHSAAAVLAIIVCLVLTLIAVVYRCDRLMSMYLQYLHTELDDVVRVDTSP